MKNLKNWIVSFVLACFLASISFVGGYLMFVGIDTVQTFVKNVNRLTVDVNQLNLKPSYKYLKSVTVRIIQKIDMGDYIGTGTIIKITDDYTYILTNKHIAPLENKDKIYVVDEYYTEIKTKVLANSFLADLSLIRIDGKIENKRAIKGIGKINYSEKIFSVGMYLGNHYIYTEGTVAGFDSDNNYIMNLPGAGGCSGSGIFDLNGELVAVVFAGNWIRYPYQTETAKMLCVNSWQIEMFLYLNEDKMVK